jgi:hypothetical protein
LDERIGAVKWEFIGDEPGRPLPFMRFVERQRAPFLVTPASEDDFAQPPDINTHVIEVSLIQRSRWREKEACVIIDHPSKVSNLRGFYMERDS